MSGKINNVEEAGDSFSKNVLDDYELMLKYPSKKSKTKQNKLKGYIEQTKSLIVGPEDIPDLETEEKAEKRQKGQGLKIMTPSQLFPRLLTLLGQKENSRP